MKNTRIFLLLLFISILGLLLSYGLRNHIDFLKDKIARPTLSQKTTQPQEEQILKSEEPVAQTARSPVDLATQFDSSSQTLSPPLKPKEEFKKVSYLKEWGIMSGFLRGDLRYFGDYEMISFILRIGFDLKPFFRKFGLGPRGLAVFELEPFIGAVISPNNNIEVGCNFLLKYAYPLTSKIYPYAEGGLGVVYMSQHTREQSTQYNFLPQLGAGVQYFLKENVSINAGYRYRHLSNASFKHPNKGIDAHMFLTGMSLFY